MNISARKNIKIGIYIGYITFIVSILSHTLLTPFLLSALGEEQYGIYSFALTLTSWLTLLASSLGISYLREIDRNKEKLLDNSEGTTNSIFFIIYGFIALFVFIVGLIFVVLTITNVIIIKNYTDDQTRIFVSIFIISIINIMLTLFANIFALFEQYKKSFIIPRLASLMATIVTPIITFVLVKIGFNIVSSVLTSFFTGTAVHIIIIIHSYKALNIKFSKTTRKVFKENSKIILSSSVGVLFTVIASSINVSMGKIVLGFMVGPIPVALFQIAISFQIYLNSLSSIVTNTFVPSINGLVATKNYKKLDDLFINTTHFQIILISLIIGGFLSVGKEFVVLWLGSSRAIIYPISAIILLASLISNSRYFLTIYEYAENKHRFRTISYLISLIINALITSLLIYFFPSLDPLYSALIGFVCSFAFLDICLSLYYSKTTSFNIRKFYKNIVKYVVILLISSISILVIFAVFPVISNLWIILLAKGVSYVLLFGFLALLTDYKQIKLLLSHRKN